MGRGMRAGEDGCRHASSCDPCGLPRHRVRVNATALRVPSTDQNTHAGSRHHGYPGVFQGDQCAIISLHLLESHMQNQGTTSVTTTTTQPIRPILRRDHRQTSPTSENPSSDLLLREQRPVSIITPNAPKLSASHSLIAPPRGPMSSRHSPDDDRSVCIGDVGEPSQEPGRPSRI